MTKRYTKLCFFFQNKKENLKKVACSYFEDDPKENPESTCLSKLSTQLFVKMQSLVEFYLEQVAWSISSDRGGSISSLGHGVFSLCHSVNDFYLPNVAFWCPSGRHARTTRVIRLLANKHPAVAVKAITTFCQIHKFLFLSFSIKLTGCSDKLNQCICQGIATSN